MNQPNQLAQDFARELEFIRNQRKIRENLHSDAEKFHVETTGAAVTELYELLRNASENAEQNLQLTHAIGRFLKRFYLTFDQAKAKKVGADLVSDLTLAGYLENDSIATEKVREITQLIAEFSRLRTKLLAKLPREVVARWTIEPLAAAIENLLNDHSENAAFADLGYNYFLAAIDREIFSESMQKNYEATLFVAVEKTLLKLEPAAIRWNLLSRYQISRKKAIEFANFNVLLDEIFASELLNKMTRIIARSQAPFNILARAMNSDKKLEKNLLSQKALLGSFDAAISESYAAVHKNINRGIVRSVIFLIITKFLIGIAAEVPYDLMIHGEIIWKALIINLLLPPVYMVALRLTLLMPDARNTRALHREISRILFQPPPDAPFLGRKKTRPYSKIYNFLYGLTIVAVFVLVAWLLVRYAAFEWIHLLIFFIFVSTASFLGFRLSRSIREIEVGAEAQTSITMLRDFIYIPFVVVGQKINETYSRLNIVSHFLDMFVELPLKTLLGFLRSWTSFLSAKKDDL